MELIQIEQTGTVTRALVALEGVEDVDIRAAVALAEDEVGRECDDYVITPDAAQVEVMFT